MLRFLRIRDFALIREISIEFASGLNLLTGETGSGKSILVDALGLILGERASGDWVRSGRDSASVEAEFSHDGSESIVKLLESLGIPHEEPQLLIRREISTVGKNRIFVNNSLTTLAGLKVLGDQLADIHGQHDHQALLKVPSHIDFLDRFGDLGTAVMDLSDRYHRLRRIAREIEALAMDEQERLRRIDLLQYQVEEIERFAPLPKEREGLANERLLLANREKLFACTTELHAILYESETSLMSRWSRMTRILQELEVYDEQWKSSREALSDIRYRLEDLAYLARDYAGKIDFTPARQEQVEQRLADLDRLLRKYGPSETDVLTHLENARLELQTLRCHSDRVGALEEEFRNVFMDYRSRSEALSDRRKRSARQLEKQIRQELQALAMEKCAFHVCFHAVPHEEERLLPAYCRADGTDRVEFLVAPNPGEEVRELARIASGGELSRIMLSLKSVCTSDEVNKTLVFDEVDAGIGGRVAQSVGKRWRQIAGRNQVLCVTHLPQIAAFADAHYRVVKEEAEGRTEISVVELAGEGRIEELARMLGGETITETVRKHAREMLALSTTPAGRR